MLVMKNVNRKSCFALFSVFWVFRFRFLVASFSLSESLVFRVIFRVLCFRYLGRVSGNVYEFNLWSLVKPNSFKISYFFSFFCVLEILKREKYCIWVN